MEQVPSVEPVVNNVKGWKSKIPAISLGLVAALFVFVILFTINYFGIFSVGRFVPGFGYLPVYHPKITPFPHNTQLSEKALGDFLQKYLNAGILATASAQYFSTNIVTERNWMTTVGDSSVAIDARLHLQETSNDVKYITLFVHPIQAVDATKLHDALTSYFTIPLPATIPCFDSKSDKSRYCQQLTRNGDTRLIVGAQFGVNDQGIASPQTRSLYLCQLSKSVADNPNISCPNVH